MDINEDVRWKQRFANYQRAILQLTKITENEAVNELEEQGLIQAFEYTHELAWNVLRDYLLAKGHQNLYGSRDASRAAFKLDLIDDGDSWMEMIRDRNRTSHTYNQETTDSIAHNIKERYFVCFVVLKQTMQALLND